MRLAAPLLLVLLGPGCQEIAGFDGSPGMDPGQDCMRCHAAAGEAADLPWTAAGTVFPTPSSAAGAGLANAEILVIDSAVPPRALTLRSNAAGNFYTAEPLTGPFHVAVQFGGQRYQMQELAPVGACNLCHDVGASGLPVPLPPPYLDAGFDYGIPTAGRLFVPPSGPDGGSA